MITNKTKKRIITTDYIICSSYLSKTFGLIFRRFTTLVFIHKKEITITLHMFFVFYPIDVILLNKDKRVVELKSNFKPFTIWMPKEKSKYIIELRNNIIRERHIEIGDSIEF